MSRKWIWWQLPRTVNWRLSACVGLMMRKSKLGIPIRLVLILILEGSAWEGDRLQWNANAQDKKCKVVELAQVATISLCRFADALGFERVSEGYGFQKPYLRRIKSFVALLQPGCLLYSEDQLKYAQWLD